MHCVSQGLLQFAQQVDRHLCLGVLPIGGPERLLLAELAEEPRMLEGRAPLLGAAGPRLAALFGIGLESPDRHFANR